MSGIFGIIDSLYGDYIAPVTRLLWDNSRQEPCSTLSLPLSGQYSGIHNDDNITPANTASFAKQVGRVNIELKFKNIEGGWVFPWQETKLLASQAKTIFIKWEPYIPPYGQMKDWEDNVSNFTFIDMLLPQKYLGTLMELTAVSQTDPAKVESYLHLAGLNKLIPVDFAALKADLTAAAAQSRARAAAKVDLILQDKGLVDPAARDKILIAVDKYNEELTNQIDALLKADGIDKQLSKDSYTALLCRLAAKARGTEGDLKQQYAIILRDHGVDAKANDNILQRLSRLAIANDTQLVREIEKILPRSGAAEALAQKARNGFEYTALEFDLICRKYHLNLFFRSEYDDILTVNAQRAKEAGVPILESFGPEMNGFGEGRYWYPFGVDSMKYVLAFRHQHDVKAAAGAKNIVSVWNPHVVRKTEKDFRDYYPGDAFVDLIAFDDYTEKKGESLVGHLERSVAMMQRLLGRSFDYAIGEWGARDYDEFEPMLSLIEDKKSRVKFNIYYNREAKTGNYVMSGRMITRYKKYLAAQSSNLAAEAKLEKCSIPDVPPPQLTLRTIQPVEFLTPQEIEQKVCLAQQSGCLPSIPAGWSPETNVPPRTATPYVAEEANQDYSLVSVFDFGTHLHFFNTQKIQVLLDRDKLPVSELADTLTTICYEKPGQLRSLNPFETNQLTREALLAAHPELAGLPSKFADYLVGQPNIFWENTIILYGIHVQKLIETNDQPGLRAAVLMGEYILKQLEFQQTNEARVFAKASFIPPKYRNAGLMLSLAEAYSQLRDKPIEEYQKGLNYLDSAIQTFSSLGKRSGIDYFSIAKAVLVAADLHAKMAQSHMLASRFDAAREEYETAKYFYDRVAALDYKNDQGLDVVINGVRINASVMEVELSLAKNIDLKYINDSEAIAGKRQLFQLLPGMARIKQAAYYLEFPFTAVNHKGYADIIQNLVLAQSGLKEIESGAPFSDQRYFHIWADLVTAKLITRLADSLAYSTSNMSESDARLTYQHAVEMLKGQLPDLLSEVDWEKLTATIEESTVFDQAAVEIDMIKFAEKTRGPVEVAGKTVVKQLASEDLTAATRALARQTHNLTNYRIDVAEQMTTLAQTYLDKAAATFARPNRYNRLDDLVSKAPVLYAELLLQQTDLDLRQSRFIIFEDNSLVSTDGPKPDKKAIKDIIKQKLDVASTNLPEKSYLRIELALTRAGLTLSLNNEAPVMRDINTAQKQEDYRQSLYPTIDRLTARHPNLKATDQNSAYRAIVELENVHAKIMAQPKPNQTMLLHEWQLKVSLAYLILASNIINSFPVAKGKTPLDQIIKDARHASGSKKEDARQALKRINLIAGRAQRLLQGMERETDDSLRHSFQPALYNSHNLRAELYHQQAIAYAFLGDKPQMQHYLQLSRSENLQSDSRYNHRVRSWVLNRFAIPKSRSTEGEMGEIPETDPTGLLGQ